MKKRYVIRWSFKTDPKEEYLVSLDLSRRNAKWGTIEKAMSFTSFNEARQYASDGYGNLYWNGIPNINNGKPLITILEIRPLNLSP
jgi:hypothetical protein